MGQSNLLKRLQPPTILILLVLYIQSATRHTLFSSFDECPTPPATISTALHGLSYNSTQIDSRDELNSTNTQQQQYQPHLGLVYNGPQTTWAPWIHEFPCFPPDPKWWTVSVQRTPADTGLLFVREMKTGSSTLAGVLLRIAFRKGKQKLSPLSSSSENNNNNVPCRMRIDHSSAHKMEYASRKKDKSYVISLLRDPTKRAISHYFHFIVSEQKQDPTDENFQRFFSQHANSWSNYYTKDLSMKQGRRTQWTTDDSTATTIDTAQQDSRTVQQILNEYNFIAITERLDESLVVLKLLLGLDTEDILYMSAKKHGSFTAGPPSHPCVYITPSFLTSGMQHFFQSEYWQNYIRLDQLLYNAAIKSLDNTIESLGPQRVQEELVLFRKARTYAQERCQERTVYRCNSKGEFVGSNSTCYFWDIGCGYECLDEISVAADVLGTLKKA